MVPQVECLHSLGEEFWLVSGGRGIETMTYWKKKY